MGRWHCLEASDGPVCVSNPLRQDRGALSFRPCYVSTAQQRRCKRLADNLKQAASASLAGASGHLGRARLPAAHRPSPTSRSGSVPALVPLQPELGEQPVSSCCREVRAAAQGTQEGAGNARSCGPPPGPFPLPDENS